MTLRRLLVTAPLALLVAILAHLAGFGTGHELGGEHGSTLLLSALSALFALGGVATFSVALGRTGSLREAVRDLRMSLPGSGEVAPFAAWLFGGGLASFWLLEWLEGHAPFGAVWVVPIAAALALAAALTVRALTRWVARAGLALAALADGLAPLVAPRFVPIDLRRPAPYPRARSGSRRGRAPPPQA